MSTKSAFCKEFAENHGISPKLITGYEVEAVYWLEHSKTVIALSVSSHVERLVNEPTWGLLQAMLDRAYEYAAASLILYIVGQPSSGEVVARTTVEAAINVLYILNGNRIERLWQYLSSYIATERRQNKLWLDTISEYSDEDKQAHLSAMAQKEKALNLSEKFLNRAFQQMGFPSRADASWPSLFDRFKTLGKATSYRTVYAAMCSQAHNDAEDLLNKFIIHATGTNKLQDELNSETVNFSRMLVYFGLQHYFEASRSYAKCFGLTEAEKEIDEGYRVISKLIAEIVRDTQSIAGS
jgi:hypothetical protein